MHTEEPRGNVSRRPYGTANEFSRLDPGFPFDFAQGPPWAYLDGPLRGLARLRHVFNF